MVHYSRFPFHRSACGLSLPFAERQRSTDPTRRLWSGRFEQTTCKWCRARMFAEAVLCALGLLVKRLAKDPEVWALAIMAALIIAFCGCGGGSKQRKREVRTNEDVEIMSACTAKDCNDQPAPPPPRTPPPPPPVRRPPDKARA